MQPIQEVLVASGNLGAICLFLFALSALLERSSPHRVQHALTGGFLSVACLAYSGFFSIIG